MIKTWQLKDKIGFVTGGGNVLQLDAAGIARTLQTNLVVLYACLRAEARAMLVHGRGGSIVNIRSIVGVLPHRGMSSYCTAKAGVDMLTRCQAGDLGQNGIRVNAVLPSLVPLLGTDIPYPFPSPSN